MTIDRIIAIISTLGLLYFAYGTWRIDRRLANVEESSANQERHLQEIRDIMVELKREDL